MKGLSPTLLLLSVVFLSACATAPERNALYLLHDNLPASSSETIDRKQPGLILGEVRLAPFLDQQGVVYQTEARQVSVAANHRWASPLLNQLRDSLVHQLTSALPAMPVFDGSVGVPDGSRRLSVQVDGFHGHFDGHARIAGSWQLRDTAGHILRRGRFRAQPALSGDGYDALVGALARGWQEVAVDLAQQVR